MKDRIEDLALFGGTPLFAAKRHVGGPNLGDRDRFLERVERILDTRLLTNGGPFVEEFERRIAERVGTRHCVAMCNGTIALEIAARAVGLSREVIVPAYTFVATAHALAWMGMEPVLCDVDSRSQTLDPAEVEKLVTPRTTGILGVHLWGRPCDIDGLTTLADRHGLILIFDAAHALGCSHAGRMIGGFGSAEILSFHATKVLNSFEGGAVVTDDDDLAAKMRLIRNFGFADYDRVVHLGTNGKMSEISAAMGVTSLESLDAFIDVNRSNYLEYARHLEGLPGIGVLEYDEREKSNYQYVVLDIDPELSGVSRDLLQEVLWAENILVRRYFFPGCHRMEPYATQLEGSDRHFPVTDFLASRVLVLPTGTTIEAGDPVRICALIRMVIANAHAIRARWPAADPAHSSVTA